MWNTKLSIIAPAYAPGTINTMTTLMELADAMSQIIAALRLLVWV